ncbi:hypothetical protein CTRI78_v003523 [Colletotrichum trifolii]|uniref:Uncharacterized protein n=1 Tax=Colletotrichum trifolii TaxID=5466 RepID=A0A4R8RJ50_COLTR|nr:hypothetical protein CTRI78_v003523 [Colletotrichum trifolii]
METLDGSRASGSHSHLQISHWFVILFLSPTSFVAHVLRYYQSPEDDVASYDLVPDVVIVTQRKDFHGVSLTPLI